MNAKNNELRRSPRRTIFPLTPQPKQLQLQQLNHLSQPETKYNLNFPQPPLSLTNYTSASSSSSSSLTSSSSNISILDSFLVHAEPIFHLIRTHMNLHTLLLVLYYRLYIKLYEENKRTYEKEKTINAFKADLRQMIFEKSASSSVNQSVTSGTNTSDAATSADYLTSFQRELITIIKKNQLNAKDIAECIVSIYDAIHSGIIRHEKITQAEIISLISRIKSLEKNNINKSVNIKETFVDCLSPRKEKLKDITTSSSSSSIIASSPSKYNEDSSHKTPTKKSYRNSIKSKDSNQKNQHINDDKEDDICGDINNNNEEKENDNESESDSNDQEEEHHQPHLNTSTQDNIQMINSNSNMQLTVKEVVASLAGMAHSNQSSPHSDEKENTQNDSENDMVDDDDDDDAEQNEMKNNENQIEMNDLNNVEVQNESNNVEIKEDSESNDKENEIEIDNDDDDNDDGEEKSSSNGNRKIPSLKIRDIFSYHFKTPLQNNNTQPNQFDISGSELVFKGLETQLLQFHNSSVDGIFNSNLVQQYIFKIVEKDGTKIFSIQWMYFILSIIQYYPIQAEILPLKKRITNVLQLLHALKLNNDSNHRLTFCTCKNYVQTLKSLISEYHSDKSINTKSWSLSFPENIISNKLLPLSNKINTVMELSKENKDDPGYDTIVVDRCGEFLSNVLECIMNNDSFNFQYFIQYLCNGSVGIGVKSRNFIRKDALFEVYGVHLRSEKQQEEKKMEDNSVNPLIKALICWDNMFKIKRTIMKECPKYKSKLNNDFMMLLNPAAYINHSDDDEKGNVSLQLKINKNSSRPSLSLVALCDIQPGAVLYYGSKDPLFPSNCLRNNNLNRSTRNSSPTITSPILPCEYVHIFETLSAKIYGQDVSNINGGSSVNNCEINHNNNNGDNNHNGNDSHDNNSNNTNSNNNSSSLSSSSAANGDEEKQAPNIESSSFVSVEDGDGSRNTRSAMKRKNTTSQSTGNKRAKNNNHTTVT